jgi:DNA-binding helix-hairpin-helix protein with protein kinase domain
VRICRYLKTRLLLSHKRGQSHAYVFDRNRRDHGAQQGWRDDCARPVPSAVQAALASLPVPTLMILPREWVAGLQGLERHLKKCQMSPAHQFVATMSRRPWCDIEAATWLVPHGFLGGRRTVGVLLS